jgi:hypothetical protein
MLVDQAETDNAYIGGSMHFLFLFVSVHAQGGGGGRGGGHFFYPWFGLVDPCQGIFNVMARLSSPKTKKTGYLQGMAYAWQ